MDEAEGLSPVSRVLSKKDANKSIYELIKIVGNTLTKIIKGKRTSDGEPPEKDLIIKKDIIIDMIDLLIDLTDDNEVCQEIL